MDLTYDNPFTFIHDVVRGNIPLSAVTLEQWIYGCTTAMIMNHQPELMLDVQLKGGIYKLHHSLHSVNPPGVTATALRTKQ